MSFFFFFLIVFFSSPPLYLFIMSHIPETSQGWVGGEGGARAPEPLRAAGSDPVSRVSPRLPGGGAPSGGRGRASGRRAVADAPHVGRGCRAAPHRAPPGPPPQRRGERKGPRTRVTSRSSGTRAGSSSACGSRRGRGSRGAAGPQRCRERRAGARGCPWAGSAVRA